MSRLWSSFSAATSILAEIAISRETILFHLKRWRQTIKWSHLQNISIFVKRIGRYLTSDFVRWKLDSSSAISCIASEVSLVAAQHTRVFIPEAKFNFLCLCNCHSSQPQHGQLTAVVPACMRSTNIPGLTIASRMKAQVPVAI
jgi:hypothetical protein